MDSVAILFRLDGVVFVGTQSGEILAVSDEEYDSSYAAKANTTVKSIDMRHDGLMSVERDILRRLERSGNGDARPVEISVGIQFEQKEYYIQASFIQAVLLWTVWRAERTISR